MACCILIKCVLGCAKNGSIIGSWPFEHGWVASGRSRNHGAPSSTCRCPWSEKVCVASYSPPGWTIISVCSGCVAGVWCRAHPGYPSCSLVRMGQWSLPVRCIASSAWLSQRKWPPSCRHLRTAFRRWPGRSLKIPKWLVVCGLGRLQKGFRSCFGRSWWWALGDWPAKLVAKNPARDGLVVPCYFSLDATNAP